MASTTAAEEAVAGSPSQFVLSASAPEAALPTEATAEEERVPALAPRASSREVLLAAGEKGAPGSKTLLLAVLGGVVLVVVGAAAGLTVLGRQQQQQQSSSQATQGEFLHAKPARKDEHEGSGNITGNSTGGANMTIVHHAVVHHAVLNVTHNSTANHSTNTSLPKTNVTKHEHLKCSGGAVAACQCLLACKVFGGQPSQCAGTKAHLLDSLITTALSSPEDACRGMQCIVRCARSLQCYDDRVQNDCRALASHFPPVEGSNTCRYECDADEGTPFTSALLKK